jgi:hypothetical protein
VRDRAWREVTRAETGRAPDQLATALTAGEEALHLKVRTDESSSTYDESLLEEIQLEAGKSDFSMTAIGWREAERLRLAGRPKSALDQANVEADFARGYTLAVKVLAEVDLGDFTAARRDLAALEKLGDSEVGEPVEIPRLRPPAVRAYLEKRAPK